MSLRPFHLAAPISSIETSRAFYEDLLGCTVGRFTQQWVDLNFFGHQLSLHVKPEALDKNVANSVANSVDGKSVPVRHFGVVLTPEDWNALARVLTEAGTQFIIEPYTRFKGEIGEQSTMFFIDPDGNVLEFKAFADDAQMFAR